MITWTPVDGSDTHLNAFDGDTLIGQVAYYDGSTPPWAAFLSGNRVGRGRFRTREQAKAALEQAYGRRG